jgi:phenylalanyl-tRNA synthetase beta chain
MKVPLNWLKNYVEFTLSPEEIAAKLTMGGLEVEGIETHNGIPVLDVYITPNRGDCLSILGVAREISALLRTPLKMPAISETTDASNAPVNALAQVRINAPDLCPRYAARVVQGVKIGPSPAWLQEALEAAGQRPVNNVVDVTNYVMLELGQPLHAFDLDTIEQRTIVVRSAEDGEIIETLDGTTHALKAPALVIADASKPAAVAGLMGGAFSEVTDNTVNILLESAHFNPLSIRRTSRALNLRTEASYRFERVVDPEGVVRAVNRACDLLHQIGQPAAIEGVVDVYPTPTPVKSITLRPARAQSLLGMELSEETCAHCLQALGFGTHTHANGIEVTVPAFRADIAIEEDLIEEVGRIHGYENIPEKLPVGETTRGGDSTIGKLAGGIRRTLVECGLQEVVTHSLTAPSAFDTTRDGHTIRVPVRNALSINVSGLRRSLIPTLLDVARHNASRGQHSLSLFEVGRIWQYALLDGEPQPAEFLSIAGLITGTQVSSGARPGSRQVVADYSSIKGVLDRLCERLGITDVTLRPVSERDGELDRLFHPGRSGTISLGGARIDGVIGELHPSLAEEYDLKHRVYVFELSFDSVANAADVSGKRYRPISRQQAISRDIAPRLSDTTTFAAVKSAIAAAECPVLAECKLTDIFRGAPLPEGTHSLTLSLTFAYQPSSLSDDRAVTEAEVNEAMTRIRAELEARCGATFAG